MQSAQRFTQHAEQADLCSQLSPKQRRAGSTAELATAVPKPQHSGGQDDSSFGVMQG